MTPPDSKTQLTTSYLICATPRSGSSLLCEALKNTNLAGRPDEYFGPMHVSRWSEQWQPASEADYLEKVKIYATGSNGVLGLKVMRLYWQNFINFLHKAARQRYQSELELLHTHFPNLHFIWITRRDKVRQAVSWAKFIQGSAWHWEGDQPQKLENLKFNPENITTFITQTSIHESAWLAFFQQNNLHPHIVVYEDFIQTYEQTALKLLDGLGIPHPPTVPFDPRKMKQQTDDLSEEWVQRYLALNRDTELMK